MNVMTNTKGTGQNKNFGRKNSYNYIYNILNVFLNVITTNLIMSGKFVGFI